MKTQLVSGICSNSLLDLQSLPPYEDNIEANRTQIVESNTQLPTYIDGGSLDFYIEPSSVECTSLLESYLHTELSVIKLDDSSKEQKVTAEDLVSYIPFISNSMFKGISMMINDEEISTTIQNYHAYEAYVNTVLKLPKTSMNTLLDGSGLDLSSPGTLGVTNPVQFGLNLGLTHRHTKATAHKHMDYVTPIIWPLFLVQRVLPTKTELKLSLKLNSSEFCLIASDEKYVEKEETGDDGKKKKVMKAEKIEIPKYRIKIQTAKLFLQKYRLSTAGLTRMERMLASGAKYPMLTNSTNCFIVDKDSTQTVKSLTIASQLPRMCYVMQVTRSSLNSIKETPFNFQTFNVSEMYMECDGSKYPGGIGYNPDWITQFIPEHKLMLKELGNANNDMVFDRNGWISGYGIIPFNLVPDRSAHCEYISLPESKTGNLNLHIKYKQPLKQTIAVIVIMEYYNVLQLDSQRKPKWLDQ